MPNVLTLLLAILALAGPAFGQAPAPPPLLDIAAIPGIGTPGREAATRLLLANLPRAFAIGPGGAWASRSGNAAPEAVAQAALEACQERSTGHAPCQLWLRDLEIAWPGRLWSPTPAPSTMGLREPLRDTVPDPRFLWWGPAQARGVVLFGHGRNSSGADSRGQQPQVWLRHFNNAGFDVWRFDRAYAADATQRAAAWMRADLAALRGHGYRVVIAAGQSRGGWNALQALDTPGLLDAAIAIAPAALPSMDEAGQARQMANLRQIIAQARNARARLAVANFRDDPFNGLPDERATALSGLQGRVAAMLMIDRPEGLAGHGAGASRAFADRFGPCLLRFVEGAAPAC